MAITFRGCFRVFGTVALYAIWRTLSAQLNGLAVRALHVGGGCRLLLPRIFGLLGDRLSDTLSSFECLSISPYIAALVRESGTTCYCFRQSRR